MDMAVKKPLTAIDGSMVAETIFVMAVASVRKVAGTHRPFADAQPNGSLIHLGEASFEVPLGPGRGASVRSPAAVMVAGQEDLPSFQFSHHRECLGDLAQGEVTKNPHVVGSTHGVVPRVNEGAVHGAHVGKGPVAVADDVGVAEMEIGGEPDRHDAMLASGRSEGRSFSRVQLSRGLESKDV